MAHVRGHVRGQHRGEVPARSASAQGFIHRLGEEKHMQPVVLDPAQARDAHILERLAANVIVWFGSVRPDGCPHVVPVWFLWDRGSILIYSMPNQEVRNIEQNPNVILALDNTYDGADVIEIEGHAHPIEDASPLAPDYLAKYAARIAAQGYTPEQMAQEYSKAIRVIPTRFF